MRYLITLILSIGFNVHAYDVPQDAVIKVYTKDGKQIGEMKRSEYKVVKIEDDKAKQKRDQEELVILTKAKKYEEKHNSIILHAGVGNDGLRVTNNGNFYEVSERQRPVFGATYCYTQTKTGVCATAFSNETLSLGIKQDF